MLGELAEAVVGGGDNEHREHHHGCEADEDQGFEPGSRGCLVDGVVADHEPEDDEQAGHETEGGVELHRLVLHRERQDEKRENCIPRVERGCAETGTVFRYLTGDRAGPDGDERGHGEVEELKRLWRIPEDLEQVLCLPLLMI